MDDVAYRFNRFDAAALLSTRARAIRGSPIDSSISLLQRQTHLVISFAMGCPGADAIPSADIERIARELLQRDPAAALNYGPTEGEGALRQALLEWVPRALKQKVHDEELLITSGGMQGLDLACKLFVNPGDLVVVEEPLYSNTSTVIRSYEGELLPVPVDADGMMVDRLPEMLGGRVPKLINVIPNFQNPTGVTLSLDRRRSLLQLADRYGCMILEDDPYGLLHFDAPCPPSLRLLSGHSPRVIAVHTFSKILAPGLRVGWVCAAPEIIAKMIDARQGMDTCTNVLSQRIIAEYCRSGQLDFHIEGLRKTYAARLDAMSGALRAAFGAQGAYRWTAPAGGFFSWLTMPEAVDAQRLFPLALAAGVAFVPGPAFSNTADSRNAIRLCFAFPSEAEIRRGVRCLKDSIEALRLQEVSL